MAGAQAVKPKHVTRAELCEALRSIANDANSRMQWEYDSLESLKLRAKIEVCDELAGILDPPPPRKG